MNELLFFLEIVLTFGCVVAAKKIFGKAGLIAWIAIAMILANLTVVKTVNLFGIDATLGNIMFASTFLAPLSLQVICLTKTTVGKLLIKESL